MHLYALIFDAWRQIAKSRESILLDIYLKSAVDCGVKLDGADNLAETKRLFFERAKFDAPPTPQAIDLRERKWVTCTRICAWWLLLLWSNVIPGLLIGYLVIERFISHPHRDVLFVVLTVILAIPMFFVAALISLCLSALFARPFTAIMNWLLPAEEVGCAHLNRFSKKACSAARMVEVWNCFDSQPTIAPSQENRRNNFVENDHYILTY